MDNEITTINGLLGCVSILETGEGNSLDISNDLLDNNCAPDDAFQHLYCDEIPEISEYNYVDFCEPITLLSDISINITNEFRDNQTSPKSRIP